MSHLSHFQFIGPDRDTSNWPLEKPLKNPYTACISEVLDRLTPPVENEYQMNIRRKILLTSVLHWIYFPFFLAFYGISFKFGQLRDCFFLLATVTVISWLPYKGCPLTAWENKLREEASIPKRRFFGLTEMIDRKLRKLFGVGLPKGATALFIATLVLIRIWVG